MGRGGKQGEVSGGHDYDLHFLTLGERKVSFTKIYITRARKDGLRLTMMYHHCRLVWSPVGKPSRNAHSITTCESGAQQKYRKVAMRVEFSVT